MKYLESYEIEDFSNYCKSRCTKIVKEYDTKEVEYYRGLYKGYMYGINTCNYLKKKRIKIKDKVLYYHFKEQNKKALYNFEANKDFTRGINHSIYDILNYISCI